MTLTKTKLVIGAIILLAVGFAAGVIGSKNSNVVGAIVPQNAIYAIWGFMNGVTAGSTNQFQVDGSGNLTTSGTIDASGAITITGAFNPDSIGSGVATQTGAATTSVSASTICSNGIIQYAPSVASASATLPTAVALQSDCLGNVGSYRDVLWENTSVAASTTLFAAGASTTIEYVSSTGANGALSGADGAILRLYSSSLSTGSASMVKIKVIPFND